ncbi:MAG TPA: pseudouridine synthase [bacterium]|nr:pseudouridine synthase [bacterium]
MRLNKFLRDCHQGSRRKCEDLIRGGLVTIDGVQVTELATLVDPEHQRVEVGGKPVRPFAELIYIAANKPRGVVVTASDPRGRKTIYRGIERLPEGVFSVGRLDMDSEGLVILTNDGKLAFRLAHPRYGIERVYEVAVKGQIGQDLLDGLAKGVLLEEGVVRAKRVQLVRQGGERGVLRVTLTEGKKHEVRRMIAGCGYEVLRLKRIRFGNVNLRRVPGGSWRNLDRDEIRGLRRLVQEAYERSRSDH